MTRNFRKGLTCIVLAALGVAASPAAADGIRDNPLARFSEPLCPGVQGLSPEVAGVMVTRMRANASDLGLELAPIGECRPNLIVAFIEDGQAFLERVSRDTTRLDQLNNSERRELLSQKGPLRTWIDVVELTRDGQPVGVRENLVEIPRAQSWSAHSRIYVPTRRDIATATVLIDRDAAEGLTVGQMADAALLYGLTDMVPRASASTPSVQHLFDDSGAASEQLSAFDTAFLKRLYSLPPNLPASAYIAGIPGAATMKE